MALLLAASASGKSWFVQQHPDCEDGDRVLHDLGLYPSDAPDPADWGDAVRHEHMDAFISQATAANQICVCFSEIHDQRQFVVPVVVVEIDDYEHQARAKRRHQGPMRAGCAPLPWAHYERQRAHLRDLAHQHAWPIMTNFHDAYRYLKTRITFSADLGDMDKLADMLHRNGFVVVPQLLTATEREIILSARQALIEHGAKLSNHLRTIPLAGADELPIPHLSDTVDQFLNPHSDPRNDCTTISAAKSLLPFINTQLSIPGHQNAYLFNDTILTKDPRHEHKLHWHQDASFWPLRDAEGVLVTWAPMCPVTEINGALQIAVGSHCETTGPLIELHTGMVQPGETSPSMFRPEHYDIVTVDMQPGDVLVFHANLFHCSFGNRSEHARIAWSCTWAVPWSIWDATHVPTHPKASSCINGTPLGEYPW